MKVVPFYHLIELSLLLTSFSLPNTQAAKYNDCDISTYYASLTSNNAITTDRSTLHTHIQNTHRTSLPYTSSNPDVWDALIDVDAGTNPNTVKLIYAKDTDRPSNPHGASDEWNREHLWPRSLGVDDSGMDNTDIHHIRPSDSSINSARGNKYLSDCGVVLDITSCRSPAHAEAASDTSTDAEVWLPPMQNRGDIARAIFYMELRYDGELANENDLVLSDCPNNNPNAMGYLSQLLQWHIDYPVDDDERRRNDAVCMNWQGNRNPYVDYPNLVVEHFGIPQSPPPSNLGGGYDYCAKNKNPTLSPVASPPTAPSPSATVGNDEVGMCQGMKAGDVTLTGFQSSGNDIVLLTALVDLTPGAILYLTDNAWTGTYLRSNEGIQKLVIPSSGIPKGSMIGYGGVGTSYETLYDKLWENDGGSFALSTKGDNIFVYCLSSSDGGEVFLNGLVYSSSGWMKDSTDESVFGTDSSALPLSLQSANSYVTLSHYDNYWYDGTRVGSSCGLLTYISNSNNWIGSNSNDGMKADLVLVPFTIQSDDKCDSASESQDSQPPPQSSNSNGGKEQRASFMNISNITFMCIHILMSLVLFV